MTIKRCGRCRTEKPVEDFGRHKKHGFQGYCKECVRAYHRELKDKNPDALRAAQRARYAKRKASNPDKVKRQRHETYVRNKEKSIAQSLAWFEKNKSRQKELAERWRLANPEKRAEIDRQYRARNPEKIAARDSLKRARKRQARPSWLSKECRGEIHKTYRDARALSENTGVTMHVDHIVPLNGKTVSGLHVPWNLQILPAAENLKKGAKLIYRTPNGYRTRADQTKRG